MSVNSLGPFQIEDLFQYGASFLGVQEICALRQVCKQYHTWSKEGDIWRAVSAREGIPLVANLDGSERESLEADFKMLYPRTLSSKKIGELIGKVVGSVPAISQYWFDMLDKPDPYEEPEKLCRDNYLFVVYPSYVERRVDRDTPLTLTQSGDLVEVAADDAREQVLTIPLSKKNLSVLTKYPLNGEEHLPVFSFYSWDPALDQSTSFPSRNEVHFMRITVVEQSRNLHFTAQTTLVERPDVGFTVTSTRIRALADAIFILSTGTCPDSHSGQVTTYARGPDTVTADNSTWDLAIGRFIHGVGIEFPAYLDWDDDDIAVVPGARADCYPDTTLGIFQWIKNYVLTQGLRIS